ncbi:MAG: hypothetical protein JXR53_09830 [Bacteroidales bacterium]|nr:hypothetical protein [Bacteroidales bacterium]
MKLKHIFLVVFSLYAIKLSATDYTVSNTNDSGVGSLRQAITSALANPIGLPHNILFNIPITDPGYNSNTGVFTIVFLDEGLPALNTGYITIDGASQTSYGGNTNPFGPEICLNGNGNTVEYCISIQNSSYNEIKDLIINEFLYGIQVYGSLSANNKITGCYLGCNYDASSRVPNYNGIEIISGANNNQVGGDLVSERNIISGNDYAGIRISDANNNLIINNYVGVNRNGSAELHNYDGITVEGAAYSNIIGGSTANRRNIASGNVAYGIDIFGVGCENNAIIGNYIGTDVSGSYAIPNTYGLLFDDRSHNNIVGGYLPGEGNLISGNTAFGAYFYNNGTNSNYLIGNMIGTDASGTIAVPNETGVHIDGATYANLVDSNLISGNLANGITLFATYSDYNTIIRNKIGTDISGTLPLGNQMNGILITQGSAHNIIGGSPALSNIIAYNHSNGVKIESEGSDFNLVSCNSIFENQNLGIELYPADGINSNDQGDPDTGPNDLLNSPEISQISFYQDTAIISGTLETQNPEHCRIEVYKADQNAGGISQGKTYLGTTAADNAGNWILKSEETDTCSFFVCLCIDPNNNTSEFSVENPVQPLSIHESHLKELRIFPNPASDYVQIADYCLYDFYNLFDLNGKIVKTGRLNEYLGKIELSNVNAGQYILIAYGSEKAAECKLIILP